MVAGYTCGIMLKLLATACVFLGLLLAQMAYNQKAATQQHAKSTQHEPQATITVNNYDHSSHEQRKEDHIAPWWPEGLPR